MLVLLIRDKIFGILWLPVTYRDLQKIGNLVSVISAPGRRTHSVDRNKGHKTHFLWYIIEVRKTAHFELDYRRYLGDSFI